MQKTTKRRVYLAVLLMATQGFAWAQSYATKDSIVTVDQMLKTDNAAAREKAARMDSSIGGAQPSSEMRPKVGVSIAPTPPIVVVESITGLGDKYRIALAYNGMRIQNASIGQQIGPCVISAVVGRNVVLAPASVADAKQKPVSPSMCPTSPWVGVSAHSPAPGAMPSGVPGNAQVPIVPTIMPNNAAIPQSNFISDGRPMTAPVGR
jgi:hypothetical protein